MMPFGRLGRKKEYQYFNKQIYFETELGEVQIVPCSRSQ